MDLTNAPAPNPIAQTPAQFVDFFRSVAPYIHAFRGETFVIAFGGELVQAGKLNALVQDLSLIHALGIKLVIVHGSRPQVNEQLRLKSLEPKFVGANRITDAAALECAKEAAGEIRLDLEALFSQGLPNTAMQNARVRVISGNFVTARPVGVVDGVDFMHTGFVRKVDAEAIRTSLNNNTVVLMSPLGFSPTGEAFNLAMEDIAVQTAIALNADKLMFLTETPSLRDAQGNILTELEYDEAETMLKAGQIPPVEANYVRHLVKACKGGVERTHLVPFEQDGACLLEVFTHDGIATMITEEALEKLRLATNDDVAAILSLIEPLIADGTLVSRGPDIIERDIEQFSLLEHDGKIFGCAALYPYSQQMGEMACLTVSQASQGTGDGERILKHIEQRAKAAGMKQLFVLTTRAMHWFMKRGFKPASVKDLPQERQESYNKGRNSQVLIKKL
jgi:amino-acid N-acetyltransferase